MRVVMKFARSRFRRQCWAMLLLLGLLAAGCASQRNDPPATRRPFNFPADTFAFANELVWEYHYDEHGKWVSHPRDPAPEYSHH